MWKHCVQSWYRSVLCQAAMPILVTGTRSTGHSGDRTGVLPQLWVFRNVVTAFPSEKYGEKQHLVPFLSRLENREDHEVTMVG